MNPLPFTDPKLLDEIKRFTRTKTIKAGETLISPGDKVVFVPIVLKGVLRIIRQGGGDKEIFLYHLYPGQTCAMAINCCQADKISAVKAIAEDDTEVLQVPVNLIDDWFKYPEWKMFVNSTYGQRFTELIEVVDLIAFSNMDKQVLHYLQQRGRAAGTKKISITHQQIADELHTHREAISRLLRTMEEKNLVRLGRNTIELL
ncbi:Crp/Fnr family transcriptional regulator [Mucilaginibacter gotjawali]|jgi:CRP/FNR family transcriptional regulator, anaerobic regulatory protein|uniref:CRP/FNR family transcriptional regulator n=1 Tax=Mucilaginibacter gotjawali TaxID=1550579 RepID=A0A839SM53_9SPHI|nr:Crp/Fnr family transcriptional regulator [Mucilaginibacter gotjawali]MBB3058956.1 CRP/FNR family transcriptional regulator [Mucilaginibacter gotjawali]